MVPDIKSSRALRLNTTTLQRNHWIGPLGHDGFSRAGGWEWCHASRYVIDEHWPTLDLNEFPKGTGVGLAGSASQRHNINTVTTPTLGY